MYINKQYLQEQFENFMDRIAEVFARKDSIPTKTSDLDNDSGFVTSQYPVEILNEEQTEANTTPDKYVSDALVTRDLIIRMGGLDFKYEDGVPKWSPRGADTWSPFSSGKLYVNMDETASSADGGKYYEVGFRPRYIFFCAEYLIFYNGDTEKVYYSARTYAYDVGKWMTSNIAKLVSISDFGFTMQVSSNQNNKNTWIIAVG